MTEFSEKVIQTILSIPPGKVMTYGQVARWAGSPRGARQVSRLLHSCTGKYRLPWFRVIGTGGKISIPEGDGYELQKAHLQEEGVVFDSSDKIDLDKYQWNPVFS